MKVWVVAALVTAVLCYLADSCRILPRKYTAKDYSGFVNTICSPDGVEYYLFRVPVLRVGRDGKPVTCEVK